MNDSTRKGGALPDGDGFDDGVGFDDGEDGDGDGAALSGPTTALLPPRPPLLGTATVDLLL